MRNAVFVLAVALILVGIVARFTTDKSPEPPAAAAKLGYVVLESRSAQQPLGTVRAEPTAIEGGEQKPMPPEAALAVANPTAASAERTRESRPARQRDNDEAAKTPPDAAQAAADDAQTRPTVDAPEEARGAGPAETIVNTGSAKRHATAAGVDPAPLPVPVAVKSSPMKPPIAPAVPAANPGPPAPRPSPEVREAQTLLGRLGYNAGAPDGLAGPRTQSAVLAYQVANTLPADGMVSAPLLARLRQEDAALKTPPPARAMAAQEEESGWSTLVNGVSYRLDRLFGREFDSVQRPEQLRAHCRANRDAWAYDRARDKLIFCGSMNGTSADNGSPHLLGR